MVIKFYNYEIFKYFFIKFNNKNLINTFLTFLYKLNCFK